jgi:hypothetical protein
MQWQSSSSWWCIHRIILFYIRYVLLAKLVCFLDYHETVLYFPRGLEQFLIYMQTVAGGCILKTLFTTMWWCIAQKYFISEYILWRRYRSLLL